MLEYKIHFLCRCISFLGRIVLQEDVVQNYDVIMKSINSQIMPNGKNLDRRSVDSPRYEPVFEVIAKIFFILMDRLYRNDKRSDFQLYFTLVWESKRGLKVE